MILVGLTPVFGVSPLCGGAKLAFGVKFVVEKGITSKYWYYE